MSYFEVVKKIHGREPVAVDNVGDQTLFDSITEYDVCRHNDDVSYIALSASDTVAHATAQGHVLRVTN